MTAAITAALWFHGNVERARVVLKEYGSMPTMLSRSRLNRRRQRITPLVLTLFAHRGEHFKALTQESIYAIESFPIPARDTIRISRAKLFQGDASRGSLASKKRDSFGLKLHGLVRRDGQPVEFFLTAASVADVTA